MKLIEDEEEQHEEGFNGIENLSVNEQEEEWKEPVSAPMYLAAGLGFDGISPGGDELDGIRFNLPVFGCEGDLEEFYKRMVDEYPSHPLLLANYAQLLQSKGDLIGAEELYHLASLADPGNGKILLHLAKLVWEGHHDQDRALRIFKHAAEVAPQDSQILGSYANFLWEMDDDGESDTSQKDQVQAGEEGTLSTRDKSTTKYDFERLVAPAEMMDVGEQAASIARDGGNVEEYYKMMLEENPSNSFVLKNYARFLCHNEGDLQRADEYYSRAVVADPEDGEIMSEYATLVWKLHHNHHKASHYYEQAAQATPANSYVLASYASFLWETEENEEESANQD